MLDADESAGGACRCRRPAGRSQPRATVSQQVESYDTRSSHLGALFRWQSGKHENLENFCTEALATAIASEPVLFVELLESRFLLPRGVDRAAIERVEVSTQGPTETGKLVDLQLHLGLRGGKRAGLWIEVKVGTGLAPNQLSAYSAELDRQYPDAPRRRD